MKKIVHILLITALTTLTQSATTHANIQLAPETQIQYLIEQAQFFAKQGIAQKDILEIFTHNLTYEKSCAAKSKRASMKLRIILLATGCTSLIVIGGGLTYYVMNGKLKTERATNARLTSENARLTTANQQAAQAQNPIAGIVQLVQNPEVLGGIATALQGGQAQVGQVAENVIGAFENINPDELIGGIGRVIHAFQRGGQQPDREYRTFPGDE